MNRIDEVALTEAMMHGGFIPRDTHPAEEAQLVRPWFIGMLVGASGWLAGLFLILFVGTLFEPNTVTDWLVACGIGFAAAFALYAIDKESAFFDQLALALWIAAQCAFVAAMWKLDRSQNFIVGSVAAMQGVLVLVTPNRLAKLIATFFACMAWAWFLRFEIWGDVGFFNRGPSVPPLSAVLGFLATWLPIIALAAFLVVKEHRWMARHRQKLFRPLLSGLLLGLSFGPLATQPEFIAPLWSPEVSKFDNWLALLPLLSAFVAVFAMYCAFTLRHPGLIGAAIAGTLLQLVQFYFVLGISLLMKSAIMMAAGAVLLVIALWLRANAQRETT